MRHGLGLCRPLEAPLVLFVSHAPLTVALMVQGGGSAKKAISSKASAVGQVTLQRAVHTPPRRMPRGSQQVRAVSARGTRAAE
jgi:hypothetical protein